MKYCLYSVERRRFGNVKLFSMGDSLTDKQLKAAKRKIMSDIPLSRFLRPIGARLGAEFLPKKLI